MQPRKYLKIVFVKGSKHLENYLEDMIVVNVCGEENVDQPEIESF